MITKQNERPFSFYQRDKEKHLQKLASEQPINEECLKPRFKAKEPPPNVMIEIYDRMVTTDQREREERIRRNAQIQFQKAKLPPRMEMHEKIQKQKAELEPKKEDPRFAPHTYKARDVPDFDKLQRGFLNGLDKKKSLKRPTEPKPFNFNEKKRDPKS